MKTLSDLLFRAISGTSESLVRLAEPKPASLRLPPPKGGPGNLLVLDVSGSMGSNDYPPTRIEGAQQAALRFIEKCAAQQPGGLLGVVLFSGVPRVASPLVAVRENLGSLREAVLSASVGDATNIGGGLKCALGEFKRVENSISRRIVLLTDGESNTGPDPLKVAQQVTGAGIQLDIIGIGGSPSDVNEADLRRMASIKDGQPRYWFIRSVGELVQRFEALALREIK